MSSAEDFPLNPGDSRFTVATLTAKLIQEYDNVHAGDRSARNRAADAAAVLCRHYDEAYHLVSQNATNYANLMSHVADASPYHPNGIDVIRRVTNREEARRLLEDLRSKYMGFAQAEATEALGDFDTTAEMKHTLLDARNWEDRVEFEAWRATLGEEEKRCLAFYVAATSG